MQGSLAFHKGSVFVGRYEKTAHVSVHDLDGRRLPGGFSFRDESVGRSSVNGLAVDDDRRVWVADAAGRRVRSFTLFGAPVGELGDDLPTGGEAKDRLGLLGTPVDVSVEGNADEGRLLVVSGGQRRHALNLFDAGGVLRRSLRPLGDPEERFRGLRRAVLRGSFVHAAEPGARRVQVFRDGEFHFAFTVPSSHGEFEPTAIAPLDDGRLVLTVRGRASAVLLVDATGRLLRVLAERGTGSGEVEDPDDVVVEEGEVDRERRLCVIDRDAERVQVFCVGGRCYGEFVGVRASESESASGE